MQFLFQTVFYDFGQSIPVNFVSPVVADGGQRLVGIGNDGRTFIRAHRRNGLYHIRNHIGVGNDNLLRLFAAEILELL